MKTTDLTLSNTENGYSLIYQGLPLCNDKQTIDDIWLVAKMYNCDLPQVAWNGISGQWVTTLDNIPLNEVIA